MHADPGNCLAGVGGKELRPEPGLNLLFGENVPGAHRHHLGAEGKDIPLFIKRQNVPPDNFSLVFPHFDKMGMNGKPVIFPVVPAFNCSPVEILNSVLFPALAFQVPGCIAAHANYLR